MAIIPTLVLLLSLLCYGESQKQCYKSPSTSGQTEGPLKASLVKPLQDFQSGAYTIVNSNPTNSSRYTCFNITFANINPKKSYEVVASIQNIDNYEDKSGMDFSVRFSPNPTVIEGLFIMSRSAVWTSAKIQYIVSARDDFRVGTFVPEIAQFLPCGKESSQMIINHKIIVPWQDSATQQVFGLPFLSGIRTIDPEMNIQFNRSEFDTKTGLLTIPVRFQQVQYPIEYLLISYLIVTMESDFQVVNLFDLNNLPEDISVFVGMTGVSTAGKKALKSSNVINKSKFQEFFQVQGLIIMSKATANPLQLDYSPNTTQQQVIQCLTPQRCQGYQGYMKYYQNENGYIFHSECILCEKFASYNEKTLQCQCKVGYVRGKGESCEPRVKCSEQLFQVYNQKENVCECKQGYVMTGGKCVEKAQPTIISCPPGFTLFKGNCYKVSTPSANAQATQSTSTLSTPTANQSTQNTAPPLPTCPGDQTFNQSTKSCQCKSNLNYDQKTKKCISCKTNEAWNLKTSTCECVNGTSRNSEGKCYKCGKNTFGAGPGCSCAAGYYAPIIGEYELNCEIDPTRIPKQTLGLALVQSDAKTNLIKQSDKTQSSPTILGTIPVV